MISPPGDGRLVGYAGVSTDDQDLSLQTDVLTHHGIPKSLILSDKLSGAKCEWDRLGQVSGIVSLMLEKNQRYESRLVCCVELTF